MAELLTYLTRLRETPRHYGKGLYEQLNKKNIFLWSQAIAFKVLITIVPVIILATGVLGQVLEREESFETVAGVIQNFLPPDQLERLINFLRRLAGVGDTLTIIGVLALLFSALTLMTTLRVVVSKVFQEDWHEKRSILWGYLFDLRMVGQVGLLFLLTIGLTIGGRRLNRAGFVFIEGTGLGFLWNSAFEILTLLIPFMVTMVMFFQLFYFIPKPAPPKRSALFGALFSAFLWEAAKSGFTLYAQYVGRFDRYGAEGGGDVLGSTFGLIIAFVFWVYYSGIVLCLGAVMALLHEKRHRARDQQAAAELEASAPAPAPPQAVAPSPGSLTVPPASLEASRHAVRAGTGGGKQPPSPAPSPSTSEDLSVN